jgi:hypothetical protein
MSDIKTFDAIRELAMLSKTISLNEFYNISINPNRPEIALQGTFSSVTAKAAQDLGVMLNFDNEDGMIRGTDGIFRIVLTE